MKRLRTLLHGAMLYAATASIWFGAVAAAWAQRKKTYVGPDPVKPSTSVLDYALVCVMIALGLAVVCRPNNRTRDEGSPSKA